MQKATVLIVDDDQVSLTLLRKLVARLDYSVIQANSAANALKALHEEAIDLVIADFDMPVMNGLELLKAVKGEYPRLPFILVTAYSDLRVIRDAWYAGAFDFFQKPVFVDRLNQTIRLAMEFGHLNIARRKFPKLEMMRPDPDVINIGVVRELAIALKREDVMNVVEEFETHVRIELEQVLRLSASKQTDEVRQLAHRMAGTAVNLGLVKFSGLMHEIELNPGAKIKDANKLHHVLENSLQWLHASLEEILHDIAS